MTFPPNSSWKKEMAIEHVAKRKGGGGREGGQREEGGKDGVLDLPLTAGTKGGCLSLYALFFFGGGQT